MKSFNNPFRDNGNIVSNFETFLFVIRKNCLTVIPLSLYLLGSYLVFMKIVSFLK
jgi:hypothetical protein